MEDFIAGLERNKDGKYVAVGVPCYGSNDNSPPTFRQQVMAYMYNRFGRDDFRTTLVVHEFLRVYKDQSTPLSAHQIKALEEVIHLIEEREALQKRLQQAVAALSNAASS